jgi:aminopeptidase N
MRTEQPKMIYLKDYQAPEYLIDETHLTFELFEDHSLVHAQLVMRRNPERGPGCRRWCWMANNLNCCR